MIPSAIQRFADPGLMNGTISAMLAFYLDWCDARISPEERAAIMKNFKVRAAEPLLRDMDGHVAFLGTSVNNHIPWMVYGAGLMALLLLEEDVRVEDDLITITNGPVSLNARVLSPVPIQISIERDYPVPFVSIKTKNPGKLLALTLQGEIQG